MVRVDILSCLVCSEVQVDTRRHILITNVPRTALAADIRRTIRQERVVGVDDGESQVVLY